MQAHYTSAMHRHFSRLVLWGWIVALTLAALATASAGATPATGPAELWVQGDMTLLGAVQGLSAHAALPDQHPYVTPGAGSSQEYIAVVDAFNSQNVLKFGWIYDPGASGPCAMPSNADYALLFFWTNNGSADQFGCSSTQLYWGSDFEFTIIYPGPAGVEPYTYMCLDNQDNCGPSDYSLKVQTGWSKHYFYSLRLAGGFVSEANANPQTQPAFWIGGLGSNNAVYWTDAEINPINNAFWEYWNTGTVPQTYFGPGQCDVAPGWPCPYEEDYSITGNSIEAWNYTIYPYNG